MRKRFFASIVFLVSMVSACDANIPETAAATLTAPPSATHTLTATATATHTPTITPTITPSPTATPAPIFGSNLELLSEVIRIEGNSMDTSGANFAGEFLSDIAWSPEGSLLAVGGQMAGANDGEIINGTWIWDVSKQEFVHVLTGHERRIAEVSWSPDGSSIATMGREKTIRVWDLDDGGSVFVLYAYPFWQPLEGMGWSPDGVHIAVGSWDNTVRIINLRTLDILQVGGATSRVRSLAWSPDSNYVASGSRDGNIRIWNKFNGVLETRLRGHQDDVTFLAWSPDGQWLASSSWGDGVWIWDINTGEKLHEIPVENFAMGAMEWSPDSKLLVIGGKAFSGGEIMIFIDVMTGEVVGTQEINLNSLDGISWSPDGMMLAVVGGEVVILAIRP